MMTKWYAVTEQIDRARELRINNTDAEKLLWNKLRNRQLDGHKFRRQHFVAGFYLDFVCEKNKLVVELDGGQHNAPEQLAYDQQRTAMLKTSGWRVLRFWNNEVMENMEGVLIVIQHGLTPNPKTDLDLSRWER